METPKKRGRNNYNIFSSFVSPIQNSSNPENMDLSPSGSFTLTPQKNKK